MTYKLILDSFLARKIILNQKRIILNLICLYIERDYLNTESIGKNI